mmetsp:Transcript_38080/g.50004  ORF Transcript_38080/g.50004 Transcript_38080/m.50004 type:complete len:153 (+) Transcript_38080:745-1203(+)
MRIDADRRRGYYKLESRMSEGSLNSELDDLIPEGHQRNAFRQKALLKIRMKLVKNLSDQNNAIAKGIIETQKGKQKRVMLSTIMRNGSSKNFPVLTAASSVPNLRESVDSANLSNTLHNGSWFKQLDFETDPVASTKMLKRKKPSHLQITED